MNMFETIGVNNPAYLLADPQGVDVIAIPCEKGKGVIARGTVVFRNAAGAWEAAAASDVAATNMLAVIDESVDTSASNEANEDAKAFRAGRLIAGKVVLKDGSAVNAAQAIILRTQGIVLDQMVEEA